MLCGSPEGWDGDDIADLKSRYRKNLVLHYLSRNAGANFLVDGGAVLAGLGVLETGQYLVRPDGYVAYRCGGSDLRGLQQYLASWLVNSPRAG